jgi:hypothetical protein
MLAAVAQLHHAVEHTAHAVSGAAATQAGGASNGTSAIGTLVFFESSLADIHLQAYLQRRGSAWGSLPASRSAISDDQRMHLIENSSATCRVCCSAAGR